jgi:hypothetical protein
MENHVEFIGTSRGKHRNVIGASSENDWKFIGYSLETHREIIVEFNRKSSGKSSDNHCKLITKLSEIHWTITELYWSVSELIAASLEPHSVAIRKLLGNRSTSKTLRCIEQITEHAVANRWKYHGHSWDDRWKLMR